MLTTIPTDLDDLNVSSLMMRLLVALALTAPGVLMAAFAYPKLAGGFAENRAFPVPVYIAMNVPLPKRAYENAHKILDDATDNDGTVAIFAAEAELLAGGKQENVTLRAMQGLARSPASVRGWIVLGEAQEKRSRAAAIRASEMAILLAPYDATVAGRRASLAGRLWPELHPDTRSQAAREARLLWEQPNLRDLLLPLIAKDEGRMILRYAFEGHREEIPLINRWLSKEQRTLIYRKARGARLNTP